MMDLPGWSWKITFIISWSPQVRYSLYFSKTGASRLIQLNSLIRVRFINITPEFNPKMYNIIILCMPNIIWQYILQRDTNLIFHNMDDWQIYCTTQHSCLHVPVPLQPTGKNSFEKNVSIHPQCCLRIRYRCLHRELSLNDLKPSEILNRKKLQMLYINT